MPDFNIADTYVVISSVGSSGPQGPQGDIGPQGVKGDPGGWVNASPLSVTDMNDLTTPGVYFRNTSLTPPANWPSAGFAGWVEVFFSTTTPGGIMQRATSLRTTSGATTSYQTQYIRSSFSTEGWGPWLQVPYLNTVSSGYLYGTSSPESAVVAPIGTRYVDTNATHGAIEWIKTIATGNTGWKVVYGDTGWRNVSGLLNPNFVLATSAGHLRLRRVGTEVTLTGRLSPAAAIVGSSRATRRDIITVPAGFYEHPGAYAPWGIAQIGSLVGVIEDVGARTTFSVQMPSGTWTTGEALGFTAKWESSDTAWPTALPGTTA